MATPATPRRHWMRRAIGILVVLGVIAGAGLVAVSQTAVFRDWLRREVLARVNARTGGHVAVGALEGNLFGRLVATDLRVVFEGQRVLAIRRLVATYDTLALIFGGGLHITTLDLDGVTLQLRADARGWNVERLMPASAPGSADDRDVTLESIRITDGALRMIRPERVWRLRGVTLAGSARFVPGATRFAIAALGCTEQGSGLRLEEGEGRFAIDREGGVAAEGVRLRTAGSQLAFDGRVGPSGARKIDAHLDVARLAAAEIRALLGARAPSSDWRGELQATGPDAALVVTGDVRAEVARDGAPRDVGRVRIDGTLDVRGPTPGGELRAALEHVDLGGIVGSRLPSSDLTGGLRLSTRADTPGAVLFALDLSNPRVGNTTVTTVALSGTADAERVSFEVAAAAAAGAARVTGTIAPRAERFDLQLTANEIDPGLLTGRAELGGRVNGTMTLAGEGFTLATSRADLVLALTPSRVGAVPISAGALAARVEKGRLAIERARLVTTVGRAEASGDLVFGPGAVPGAGGLRGELRATDLRPVATLFGRPDVSGAATVTFGAQGRPEALDWQATLSARRLAGSGWQAATLDAEIDTRRCGDPKAEANVHARGHDVTVAERRLSDVELSGWWRGNAAAGRAGIDLRGREAALQHQLSAELTLGADENRVTITKLRFDQQGQSWAATGMPVLVQRGDRITIEDLAVSSPRGGGHLRGVIARTGESDLELVVDALDLEALAGLVPADIEGRLAGRVHLGGTLAAPRFDGDIAVEAPTLGGVRYHELRARLAVSAGRLEGHARLAQATAQALVVDGAVPVRFALAPWQFEVTGDCAGRLQAAGIDLAFLGSLWPGLLTKVGGTITGDVTFGGAWAAPEAHGTVSLAGGRGYLVPLGVTYDPVDLELRLAGRAASIERFSIRSGKGQLTGGGAARLGGAGAVMDARFEAKSFPLFANQYGKGAANGWLWVSGPLAAPVLEGSLETDGLVLQIPEAVPTAAHRPDPTIVVVGPGAPVTAPPSATPPLPPVAGILDRAAVTVQLAVPRNAWVRRSDANVEIQGWMTAWKKPGEDFHLAGDIRGVRGWYGFQGKKFSLAEGSVRFSGQGLDPVLDITATHTAGEYLVRLRVGGTLTKPSLRLESEPALDQADVLAVLLFGAPASQLSRSQSTGLREQALGIAGAYVAAELRQSVANALGVDDLRFDTGTAGLQDARVSIGKYVADDIFVSLAHRFGAQSVEEMRIEYVIRPEWSLETSTDTLGRSGVDLFWKRRY